MVVQAGSTQGQTDLYSKFQDSKNFTETLSPKQNRTEQNRLEKQVNEMIQQVQELPMQA